MLICLDLRTGDGCGAENRNGARHCRRCGAALRVALKLQDPDSLVGPYRIVRVLGHGGFGAVYEAEDTRSDGRRIALKETFDANSIRSFQGEFAILSSLEHPNLPNYYEMFEANGSGYLVMELVPGQSLQDVLNKQNGPLLESQVLGFALQLCDVLSYLHSQHPPILHRDIKPANVRLTPEGLIKLVDFGLLKQGMEATQNSRRGLTPAYAPLEQWGTNDQHTEPRSDIYSLGATLYHLLTGRPPALAIERLTTTPDPLLPPRRYNSSLSHHVAAAVENALELLQEKRCADAVALKRALMGMGQAALIVNMVRVLEGHSDGVLTAAWSPDGRYLASGGSDRTVRLWDANTGELLHIFEGHSDKVASVTWSPDGRVLASGSGDRTVCLWHVADKCMLHTLADHTGGVASVAWSPDGQYLASGGSDKTVRLWHVGEWGEEPDAPVLLRVLRGHSGSVGSLAWSPDGQMLVSEVSLDNTLRLWRVADGRMVQTLREQLRARMYFALIEAAYVGASVAWAPDGQTLASGGGLDSTVRLWSVADGRVLRMLEGHDDKITSITYSPDGQTLASASLDRTVRLWSVADGRLLHTLEGHTDAVTSVVYSPDGQTLVSAGLDRTVRLWRT